jgi:hypothetical protein
MRQRHRKRAWRRKYIILKWALRMSYGTVTSI